MTTREPQATDLQIIAYALEGNHLTREEVRAKALEILGLPKGSDTVEVRRDDLTAVVKFIRNEYGWAEVGPRTRRLAKAVGVSVD